MRNNLITLLILIIAIPVVGLTYNYNEDCIVNFVDYNDFAGDWSNKDFNDLADFADEWMTYEPGDANRVPEIASQTINIADDTSETITISASDDNDDPLTYYIESLPVVGSVTGVNSVPAALAGNSFEYTVGDVNAQTITIDYSADDGSGLTPPCGGKNYGYAKIIISSPAAPTAYPNDVNAMAYVTEAINLTAFDGGDPEPPGKLRYIITNLPNNAVLQDPENGGYKIEDVNYTLTEWSRQVYYTSETTGMDSFEFQAYDGGGGAEAGYSNKATIDVNVVANTLDCLDFNGFAQVELADVDVNGVNDPYDLKHGWAAHFYLKTLQPFSTIMNKRDSNGVGWKVGLQNGKPCFWVYDSNGLQAQVKGYQRDTLTGYRRIDNGKWIDIQFNFTVDGSDNVDLCVGVEGVVLDFQDVCPNSIFVNDANLVIGSHYKGQIDRLRFLSGVTNPTSITSIVAFGERTDTFESALGFGIEADVFFEFDEGSGTTVTDFKQGFTGTLDEGVGWYPSIRYFSDSSIKQFYNYRRKQCESNGL